MLFSYEGDPMAFMLAKDHAPERKETFDVLELDCLKKKIKKSAV